MAVDVSDNLCVGCGTATKAGDRRSVFGRSTGAIQNLHESILPRCCDTGAVIKSNTMGRVMKQTLLPKPVGKHMKTSFPAMNLLITFSCSFFSKENPIALVALVTTDITIRIIINITISYS